MRVDKEYLQRAKIVYSRMGLEELLTEENLMQKYIYRHGCDNVTQNLYAILRKEIEKRLN
ncbi:MAG: hypothetical protein QW416_06210 [Candidatus Nitrosocaldaceae archaeon]